MSRYVALLRGINVGGNNLIKMSDLRACFEALGFGEVATFIASGNVLFTAKKGSPAALCKRIEGALSRQFAYSASVVLRSDAQLAEVVAKAPRGFGTLPKKFRYDVLFLKEPLEAAEALKSVPLKEGVDAAFAGPGALYFSRLIAKATQSRLSKIVGTPIYKQLTIRNWNTTTALARLAAGDA